MKKEVPDSELSMDQAANVEKVPPNKDKNSLDFDIEQQQWADMEDEPVDFSKPTPGMPPICPIRNPLRETEQGATEKDWASEQISLPITKLGKVCWKWLRGRCQYEDKCWFAHNNENNADWRSRSGLGKINRDKTQLHHDKP